MHDFADLILRATRFNLYILKQETAEIHKKLENCAYTHLIKNLQMLNIHKIATCVGMFSIYEAQLQDYLDTKDGFKELGELLVKTGNIPIKERFEDYKCAINVLKHGKGPSYDKLKIREHIIDFTLKNNEKDEVDISQVYALIHVDDKFAINCANIIDSTWKIVKDVENRKKG